MLPRARTFLCRALLVHAVAALGVRASEPDAEPSPRPAPCPGPADLASLRWKRRPSRDFLEHLRSTIEREGSLATETEALGLKNNGAEENRKILSALGRLPDSDAEVDWDATCNRFVQSEPGSLNPLFRTTSSDGYLVDLLYATPFVWDWDMEEGGDLNVIESWETSEDGLIDKVVLRDDLTWSDGAPFTARDIEFSWKVIMDPRVPIPAVRSTASKLHGVKAVDERTVIYLQNEALATNHLNLGWPVIPRHIYEKSLEEDPTCARSQHHVRSNTKPVTNGPYRFVSWEAGEIILERRKEWYLSEGRRIRDKPFFQRIRFRPLPDSTTRLLEFTTGALDDAQLDAPQWVGSTVDDAYYERRTKVRGEQWAFAFIGWNARSVPPNPFFGDKRVRLAMAHAIDHEFMLNDMLFGIYEPGRGIFHPDSWMAARDLKPLRRDIDLAEKLLDEAGWRDSDGDGVRDKLVDGILTPFRFPLSCPDGGSGPKLAELIKANLKKIGVECDVKLGQFVAFNNQLQRREAQAYLMVSVTGTDPDTMQNLFTTAAIENGRNYAGYSNRQVDELFEKGRRELDPKKRAGIYAEIDRLVYADHPLTILLYQPTLWGFSKSMRGYRNSPRGFYSYMPGFLSVWKKKAPP